MTLTSSYFEKFTDFLNLFASTPNIARSTEEVSEVVPDLYACTEDDLKSAKYFAVECPAYGKVVWIGEVDVRGLELDDIVTFVGHAELDVKAHPLFDHRLNRPAVVTLYNLHVDSSRVTEICLSRNVELIEYDTEIGNLTFRVEKFY